HRRLRPRRDSAPRRTAGKVEPSSRTTSSLPRTRRDDLVEELPVAFADDLERSNPARRSLEPSTAVILPASVANDLPDGTVAVVVSHPTDQIENQLVWRADDENPIPPAFIELSTQVFPTTRTVRA